MSLVKRSPKIAEKNSGETLVEKRGYISKERRIKSILAAGERLIQMRKEGFMYPNELPDDECMTDPTSHPNFDLADGTQILRDLERKRTEREKEIAAEKAAKIAHREAEKAAMELKNKDE